MDGQCLKAFHGGGYTFEVWEGWNERGLTYFTMFRVGAAKEDPETPIGKPNGENPLQRAMQRATAFANALQRRAELEDLKSPRPSPAPREARVAARPLPLDGLLTQTIAGGGCAEGRLKGRTSPSTLRVLSRSHDSVELLLKEEEEL